MSIFIRTIIFLFAAVQILTPAFSDENRIKAYFFNDSVNGFQFSDAYETHNMGLRFDKGESFYQIDLGIITPDMFEFENRFRTANRSFGELISLMYGRKIYQNEALNIDSFVKLTSQGKFGISHFQSMIHKIANFKDDIDLLEEVRMPSKTWLGIGTDTLLRKNTSEQLYQFGFLSYFGSDRISFSPYLKVEKINKHWTQFGRMTVDLIVYDEIITAPPVEAQLREIRPLASFGLSKKFGPVEISVSENLSLPSIASDNRVYARLFMIAQISLEDIGKLFYRKH